MMMGGGLDVDAAFAWMINRAKGGDFLVLRSDNDDAYDPYIYGLGPLNSVATLVIINRAGAFDPFSVSAVSNADAIFFTGGNQFTYYYHWKDTPMGDRIIEKMPFISVGGTSAGQESLAQFLYTGQYASTQSKTALHNPYDEGITLATDFWFIPYLRNVILDAHFVQRDRMGRLLTFMARLLTDGWSPNAILGVGVDQSTAVLMDYRTGAADLVSWYTDGCAYFLTSASRPARCHPSSPLEMMDVDTYRVCGNQTGIWMFDTWTGNPLLGTTYQLSVFDGNISSTQLNGSIY